ncbi:hypothetical protein P3T76_006411 [Phytophthora citrophthora]|uniref:Uncharacterized protein n=1 Tax=Phytophthora citrophthora TaxID=4793 RepID=A0AAD9GNJ0_9STRA|nr:hypothetical protein P3T76_006411 [Phytophthora citrophthora]
MMESLIKAYVHRAYAEFMNLQLSLDDIDAAGNAAIDQLRVIQSQPSDSKATQELRKLVPEAFKQDYKGDADVRFQRYLTGCCYTYLTVDKEMYKAPYVTITQSSGFGKSRILKRLAEKEGPIKHGNAAFDIKVLYVCARDIKGSSGYPRATPKMCDWLFPAGTCTKEYLATALEKAFRYSVETSDARESWKKLFEVDVNGTADGAMAGELNSVQLDKPYKKRQKLEARNTAVFATRERLEARTTQVLVVAIDEARALLTIENSARENAFHILRRALREVNTTATVRNANGLVFAVLADTNSRVHEFVPELSQDPSSRLIDTKNMALFPPFILTETMDIMLGVKSTSDSEEDPKMSAGDTIMDSESDSEEDPEMSDVDTVDQNTSRSRVLTTDEKDVWAALVSMGRPLWRSMDNTKTSLPERKDILTKFAARKLLIGLEMNKPASYTDSTLHGVSSLFCRIGLRPSSRAMR